MPFLANDVSREASAIGDRLRRQLAVDPYQNVVWDSEVGAKLRTLQTDNYSDVTQLLPPEETKRLKQQRACELLVEEQLAFKGLSPTKEDIARLAKATSLEVLRVVQNHHAFLLGRDNLQPSQLFQSMKAPSSPLSFDDVVEGWLLEKKPSGKTEYVWRRVLRELGDFVGHQDARRLSADDLIAWKVHLLNEGRKAKTIRDSKLAPIRAMLQWATDNRKLDANPATRITINLKTRSSENAVATMMPNRESSCTLLETSLKIIAGGYPGSRLTPVPVWLKPDR